MIWIDESNHVADITKSVPYPLPETPREELPLYQSRVPIDKILEVNAGFADAYDIAIGDEVKITLFPSDRNNKK